MVCVRGGAYAAGVVGQRRVHLRRALVKDVFKDLEVKVVALVDERARQRDEHGCGQGEGRGGRGGR